MLLLMLLNPLSLVVGVRHRIVPIGVCTRLRCRGGIAGLTASEFGREALCEARVGWWTRGRLVDALWEGRKRAERCGESVRLLEGE